MFPVSQAFLNATRGSHQLVSRARIVTPGFIGTSPPENRDLEIITGSVTLDNNADIRGTLDIDVAEPWPNSNTTNDVVPYGTEIQITRGIVFGTGDIRVPLGIFRITDVEQDDVRGGPLRVIASDRMHGIIESKLELPRVFTNSTFTFTVGQVVDALVQDVYPGQIPQWDDLSVATGYNFPISRNGVVVEEDRFDYINSMMVSLGKIWYFDYRGQLVVRTITTGFSTTPVYSVNAGENGVLVSANRQLNREGVFNVVRVVGTGFGGAPVYGVARDLDSSSATYYYGPFGKVPKFITSSTLSTPADCVVAAQAELRRRMGFPYSVDFSMVPNPALEPWDTVEVVYPTNLEAQPHTRTERHVLDQLTIGLGTDSAMMCNTKLSTNQGATA